MNHVMRYHYLIFALVLFVIGHAFTVVAQTDEVKLDAAQTKITTVSAMRARKSYREWVKAHAAEVVSNEFAGGYQLRADVLWNLEKKYHALPIAERMAWEASQMLPPSDCEGDAVCDFFLSEGEIRYLALYPTGAHAAEAIKNITEALSDEVITFANEKGGDKYAVEQRAALMKVLISLRPAVAKTSAPEKSELVKKLERITR